MIAKMFGNSMSSLIFYTDKLQILVATDTLAVTSDGKPFAFISKATHIPHLRTIIAGTGFGGFSNEWAFIVNTRMIVKGILSLNYHTPSELKELWKKYKTEYSIPNSFTTTLYQFGLSEEDDSVMSFAYRSTNNFESEKIEYGVGVKPECTVPQKNLIEKLPQMMEEQRRNQNALPKESRLFIGGEIQALHLTKEGCESFNAGKFPDFDENERDIYAQYGLFDY